MEQCNKSPDSQLNTPVIDSIKRTLRETVLKSPSSFIRLSCWKQNKTMLKACSNEQDLIFQQALDGIAKRNEVLRLPAAVVTDNEGRRLRQAYIKKLDDICPFTSMSVFFKDCAEMTQEPQMCVHATIEWGSSIYRRGEGTVYRATRILRLLSQSGVDLTAHVLEFLAASSTMPGLDKRKLYRIFAELFRSQHLAVSKYLQWAIARGVSAQTTIADYLGPCEVRLLLEIPLSGLPEHVINLRGVLINRLGASLQGEAECIANLRTLVANNLEGIEPLDRNALASMITPELSQTVRSDVASWIRVTVLSFWASYDKLEQSGISPTDGLQSLQRRGKYHDLKKTIEILERLEDYSILADVLRASTLYRDRGFLLDAAECVNLHFDTFAAIGASADLFKLLFAHHRVWQNENATNMGILESLLDLGSRIPRMTEEVEVLRRSIVLSKQKHSVMACSPVSDHVAEALQSAEENFADELEQALAIGTTMDPPTMKQLLDLIMDRFELSWASLKSEPEDFAEMLEKLKHFDHDGFDTLFNYRLQRMLLAPDRPVLCSFIPCFVSARCTTLESVLCIVARLLGLLQDSTMISGLAIDAFELLTLKKCEYDPGWYSIRHIYRFFEEQYNVIAAAAPPIVPIISTMLKDPGIFTEKFSQKTAQRFRSIVSALALQQPQALAQLSLVNNRTSSFLVTSSQPAIEPVPQGRPDKPLTELRDLFAATDDFNGPIVLSLINIILPTLEDGATAQLLDTFISQKLHYSEHTGPPWTRVVPAFDERHSSILQEQAELRLLSCLPDLLRMPGNSGNDSEVTMLLSIITTTDARLSVEVAGTLVKLALDSFALIFAVSQKQGTTPPSARLERTIGILLSILTLHLPSVEEPSFSQSLIHDAIIILSIIMTDSPVSSSSSLCQQLNDLLIVLSDSLHEDTRTRLSKTRQTLPTPTDPRFDYILGRLKPKDGNWLQILPDTSLPPSASTPGKTLDVPKRVTQPFPIRKWEMMQDATPLMGENDTSLSLTLFGARKATL